MSNKSYLSVYAKSFSWAGFFLPRKTLKKCSALYDFCRVADNIADNNDCLLYTSPSPRDRQKSRMPSSA